MPRLPSPSMRRPETDTLLSSRSVPSRQGSRASMNNSMNMFSQESRALLLAKMTRKRADEDVVAMQNRINRLKMEEYRARKNIEDTQNKADDIVRLKAQNELKARAKEKAKQLHEEQLQRERQQKTLERATRDANIRVRREARHLQRCEIRVHAQWEPPCRPGGREQGQARSRACGRRGRGHLNWACMHAD